MKTTLIINITGLSIILIALLFAGVLIYTYYKQQYNKYKQNEAADAERRKISHAKRMMAGFKTIECAEDIVFIDENGDEYHYKKSKGGAL